MFIEEKSILSIRISIYFPPVIGGMVVGGGRGGGLLLLLLLLLLLTDCVTATKRKEVSLFEVQRGVFVLPTMMIIKTI